MSASLRDARAQRRDGRVLVSLDQRAKGRVDRRVTFDRSLIP
jgi:hypothetical protein